MRYRICQYFLPLSEMSSHCLFFFFKYFGVTTTPYYVSFRCVFSLSWWYLLHLVGYWVPYSGLLWWERGKKPNSLSGRRGIFPIEAGILSLRAWRGDGCLCDRRRGRLRTGEQGLELEWANEECPGKGLFFLLDTVTLLVWFNVFRPIFNSCYPKLFSKVWTTLCDGYRRWSRTE